MTPNRRATDSDEFLSSFREVLDEVKSHNKVISERVEQEIKVINSKVFDHDKSLVLIAKVMEDINCNFSNFTSTVSDIQKENNNFQKKYQEAQYNHWRSQDEINSSIKAILDNLSKLEPKIHCMEQNIASLNTESAVREVTDVDIEKRIKIVEEWQTWALKALISNAVVAIGSLIMVIYKTLIH